MNTKEIRILTLLAIDTAFFFLELIIGYAVHSLALVADSFHMLNDVFSLIVALWAVRVAKSRGVDSKYTYGWQRAEILGALINGVFLVALCMTIFLEAIQRFVEPQEISNPKLILIVGSAGLASNIVGLVLFHDVGHAGHNHDHGHGHSHSHSHSHDEETHSHDQEHEHSHDDHDHAHANTATVTIADPSPSPSESTTLLGDDVTRAGYATLRRSRSLSSLTHINHYHNKPKEKAQNSRPLNMQGVFLHVMGDALGNIGVMLTALFIWLTDYSWRFYMDPMISLVITCIIFSSALPLCRNASSILLQGVPESIDADEVKEDLASLPGVENIHDLHIWILREDLFVATLHVSVSLDEAGFMDLGSKIRKCLRGHGIQSVTIQPEFNCPPATPESLSAPHCVTQGHMSTGGLSS